MGSREEWDPLRELARVQQRLNELFDRALAGAGFEEGTRVDSWVPRADVYESGDCLVHELELPGLESGDVDVRLEGDELIVEGERALARETVGGEQFHRVERPYGHFARRFRLPSTVDRASIDARFREGVLEIRLRKREGGTAGPIRVPVR